ncbi:MAG: carbohydrate ABC transporter permease [Acholeplasmataceae bacterium]
MKRITPKIKKLDLIASLINLLYVVIAITLIIYLFTALFVPERALWENPPVNYRYDLIFGISIAQTTMNIIISLLVGFLIIGIPMTFKSFQRYFDKKTIEVDEWSYRHQYLLSFFEIVTLNPFSAAIRIYLGRHIQLYVSEYGMKQGLINSWKAFNNGLISSYRALRNAVIKLERFIRLLFKRIIRMFIAIFHGIVFLFKWLLTQLKVITLAIAFLFVNKESARYHRYLDIKEKDKKALKEYRAKRKQERVAHKNELIALKESAKDREKTQDELDEITRKDVVMRIVRIILTYGTLSFTALFIFIPFYWMIITSLKTYIDSSMTNNPSFFVSLADMQWVNFKIALTEFNFLRYIGNTVFVGLTTMFFTVITTVLAAFAFSRLDFKGKDFIFSLLLMTMMIPGELYTITNYITVSRLGWIDSFYALIVPFSASVFYIFFLRQTFRQIPDTLYRAAKVDGCSDLKYLTRVMIPIAAPTIVTIIILSSIGAWDAYIWPQLVGRTDATRLVSVALRNENFSIGVGSDQRPMYNLQLAATTIVTVPLLIVFFSLKKYILAGVGRSGTKG